MVIKNGASFSKLFNKTGTAATLLVFLAMLGLLIIPSTYAQNRAAGEIRGTVTDTTGAVIPGVAVTIENTLTGVITNLTTDRTGVYDAASVDPGTYTVSFAKQGFKKEIKSNIILHVEAITVDATLEVGSVTQQVEVTAGAALVQTETSDRGSDITSYEVAELPSVGRDWFDFTFLLPGANGAWNGDANGIGAFNGAGTGFNGQGGYQMLYLMDGGNGTQLPSQNYEVVPIQAISEVQLETSNFSAEYSNALGVMNVILKSGTNKFHGEGFEFVQNDIFDARNFFTPSIPPFRWNMFGGTIGGPIKKDKLFFFFSFQDNPVRTYATGITTYPTAAERGGDLSGLPQIYDPNTLVQTSPGVYTRSPFAGNIIPTARISPAAAAIMNYYPMPNIPGAGLVNNYYYDVSNPASMQNYDWKVNYNISSGNRLSVSQDFYLNNLPEGGQVWPTCFEKVDCVNEVVHMPTQVISDVWSITPNVVNEYRQSLQRFYATYLADDVGKDWGSILGIAQLTAPTFPGISISGSGAPNVIGESFKHSRLGTSTIAESDTLTVIKGKHILKFGGEYDTYRNNQAWADINAGDFTFSGQFTEDPQNPSATGAGFADFLLGVPNSWNDGWTPAWGNRISDAQAFAQDDFKVTPKLTLNLGLRWLAQRGYTEQFNRQGSFDPTIVNPATGTLGAMWYGGQDGRRALQATLWHNFEPRLGFAWTPKQNWSVRAGYGIFDNMWGGDTFQVGVGLGISPAGYTYAQQPLVPYFQLANGQAPPAIPVFPPSASFYNGNGVTYWPYHTPMAYVEQWHLSVQHQFKGDTMVEVGYVGTRGVKLSNPSDLDQVPEAGIQQIIAAGGISVSPQPYRPYPNFTGITLQAQGGWSDYNALQITVKKNLSHGLWFQTNYTWSHALDTNTQNGWAGSESDFQIALDPALSYGNSQIDERHMWNGQFIYQLPFGQGEAFLNRPGVLNGVVGGWQLSNTWTALTGQPFSPTWAGGGSDFSGSGTWYPNRVCNGSISNPSIQGWFNTACFPVAADGTYGNSGRDILFGPGWFNMNSSLAKSFKLRFLGEQELLQIRMEATDVTNRPNFSPPGTGLTPPPTTAGLITSARTSRNVQLGVRITF